MDGQSGRGGWIWAGGATAAIVALALAGAWLDLGPFKERELGVGELIANGDTICRDAHDAFAELQREPPQTAAQAAELTGQLIGIATDELERLRALEGPPEFEANLDRYLEARERGIEAMRDGRDAAAAGDDDAYTEAQRELLRTQRERRELARELGFAVCSRPLR